MEINNKGFSVLLLILLLVVATIFVPIPSYFKENVVCKPGQFNCPKKGDIIWKPSISRSIWDRFSKSDNKGIRPGPSLSISSYDECVAVKGSRIEESYPQTCVTASGQRFTQPTPTNSVSCGGWNTGGNVLCKCTGKLIKPACPPKTVCDAIDYRCDGQCEQCCWKGIAENNQYPKCQD